METAECLGSLACMLLLSGCVSLQVAGQVEAGRQALLMNNPTEALTHLEQAVQTNPQYVYEAESFREGVWTYLGRAQYETGNLEDARRSFERALALHKDDYLARLYLGLTLARAGDRSAALKQIASGLKGLRDWLQYMNDTYPFDAFWDPLGEIRSEIDKDLAMISAKDIDWSKLISSGERVGKMMEEEIDKVRRDERRKYEEERDRRPGVMSWLAVSSPA